VMIAAGQTTGCDGSSPIRDQPTVPAVRHTATLPTAQVFNIRCGGAPRRQRKSRRFGGTSGSPLRCGRPR
jgi:hypothetical protein